MSNGVRTATRWSCLIVHGIRTRHVEPAMPSTFLDIVPGAGLETHRNINSASGLVLAPEVQPGPHQVLAL